MTLRMSESRNLMPPFHIFLLASKEGLSFKTEVEVVIELIQVYNWEIRRNHSTIWRCKLVDILYFSIFPYWNRENKTPPRSAKLSTCEFKYIVHQYGNPS